MRTARTLLVAPILATIVGCDDPAGPPPFEVSISGPKTVVPFHGHYESGQIRVQCNIEFTIRAGSGGNSSATWTGGRFRWFDASDSTLTTTEVLTAGYVAERIWGEPGINSGESRTFYWTFWDARLFRVVMELEYRTADKRVREAKYAFDCVPVAPGLSGRYRLSMIGNAPLPAHSVMGDEVHEASIDFFPKNLTYRSRSRGIMNGSEAWDVTGQLSGYEVMAVDRFRVPAVTPYVRGDELWRGSGTSLFFEESWGDLPRLIWRFELDDSASGIPIGWDVAVKRNEWVSPTLAPAETAAGWVGARRSAQTTRDH